MDITDYKFEFCDDTVKVVDKDDKDGVEIGMMIDDKPWLMYLSTADISRLAQHVGLISGSYSNE